MSADAVLLTAHVSITDIQRAAAMAAFGKPLVTNVLRGLVAEVIVASALEPDWEHCSQDYSGWDLKRADGKLLEVKQSAVRQSWTLEGAKPSECSFDIKHRKGRYDGATWMAADRPTRFADFYVFAHHFVFDDTADHRDPAQWDFYVVPTAILPLSDSIGLKRLRKLVPSNGYSELRTAVTDAANVIR